MPKAPINYTKKMPQANTIPRWHYKSAAHHYCEFAEQNSKSNMVPRSKVTYLFEAIMVLSRCHESILVCKDCKCFFRPEKDETRHAACKIDKTIKQLQGKYKIQTIQEMEEALSRFYYAIDGSYITEDGWRQLPIDNSRTCFTNEKITVDLSSNRLDKSGVKSKLLKEVKKRQEINKEFSKSLTAVKMIKKGLKRKIKYHKQDYDGLHKESREMFAKLNARISNLEEENKKIREVYHEELAKSYVVWAHTFKTLSNDPDYGTFSELRRGSQSWLSIAMERQELHGIYCGAALVLERALSENPREYQKKTYERGIECRCCREEKLRKFAEKFPMLVPRPKTELNKENEPANSAIELQQEDETLTPAPRENKENEPANSAIEIQQEDETPIPAPTENQVQCDHMITPDPLINDSRPLEAREEGQAA